MCVTPSSTFRLATSRNMLRRSFQLRSKLVNASADTRGLPYMRAADDVGRIGLKFRLLSQLLMGCQNSVMGTSAHL